MDKYIIGKNIKENREQLKMTQLELGALIGVTSQTISGWESGYRTPDVFILNRIAKIFNTDINTFLEANSHLSSAKNENASILNLTKKETQLIGKLRSLPAEKRHAFEILLGVNDS